MGQLKEVRTAAETMEKGRESLLSIGRVEGRPSGLLEPNKCGRKKSTLRESRLQKLQQLERAFLDSLRREEEEEALAA